MGWFPELPGASPGTCPVPSSDEPVLQRNDTGLVNGMVDQLETGALCGDWKQWRSSSEQYRDNGHLNCVDKLGRGQAAKKQAAAE